MAINENKAARAVGGLWRAALRLGVVCALSWTASAAVAQSTYPKMKLRLAHFLPATFAAADVDQWFADELKRRSQGAIDVEVYWAGTMGGPNELLGLVSSGAVEMAAFPFGYYPKQFPLTGVGILPNVFSGADEAYRTFEKVAKLPEIQAEHGKQGVVMLTSHFSNPYRLACNRPMKTLEEMKGYRVRSVGDYMPQVYQALGLVPVTASSSEVYENLERGVMTCTYLSYDMMVASKIFEVAKYTSDINLGALATWQIWMNKKKFDALPEAVRQLVLQVSADASRRDVDTALKANATALETLEAKGVALEKLKPADAYAKRVPSMVDVWKSRMQQAGLQGDANKILEIVK